MPAEVTLRDVLHADLPMFYLDQLDPDATRMAAFPARDKDAFMAHWSKIVADKGVKAMTILADDIVVGNIVCWESGGERLIGYWIGKEFWGRGIATNALREFLVLVKTRPLHAHVAKHNIGSIRVLEKCGFSLAGESDNSGDGVEELIMKLG